MATAANIKYDVTCGVLEEGKTIKLMYEIDDKTITWRWIHHQSDKGTAVHVAEIIGHESQRGHRSQPIPDDCYQKLGKHPDKSREGGFYKVKMSRKDKISIESYFNMP